MARASRTTGSGSGYPGTGPAGDRAPEIVPKPGRRRCGSLNRSIRWRRAPHGLDTRPACCRPPTGTKGHRRLRGPAWRGHPDGKTTDLVVRRPCRQPSRQRPPACHRTPWAPSWTRRRPGSARRRLPWHLVSVVAAAGPVPSRATTQGRGPCRIEPPHPARNGLTDSIPDIQTLSLLLANPASTPPAGHPSTGRRGVSSYGFVTNNLPAGKGPKTSEQHSLHAGSLGWVLRISSRGPAFAACVTTCAACGRWSIPCPS